MKYIQNSRLDVREKTSEMESNRGNMPYNTMVAELKEKLRVSEESRRSLQQKFDAMMQNYKVKEQARYNALRKRYGAFLEEDQRRQQRNENLLQMLERIDNRSASLAARTERLAILRKHYEQYLGQIYPSWKAVHRSPSASLPVKIREYHDEDVSGYGTHTGSSTYVRDTERYEEPRMPPMSTPRANTHLFKTDTVLPDKYRIPRVDFDMPSISVTKPDEDRRSSSGIRMPRLDAGRFETSKLPDVATRNTAVSPRERTPRDHLSQPEFEVDQNTSGDLLNMSLSDDGVPSLTRSETDALGRHQHWETLRQAYTNRQQPHYNEHIPADESSQDVAWSRQRETSPEAYEHRASENERHLPQEHSEQVSMERESFRDKIRRLKVMIQENKELERSIEDPVNGNADKDQRDDTWDRNCNNDSDSSFQHQRVRRQSVVDGVGNLSRQDDGVPREKEDTNGFEQQRVRRQSVVDTQGNAFPGSRERSFEGSSVPRPTVGENKIAEGVRVNVLPPDKVRLDTNNDYQSAEWTHRPNQAEEVRGRYMPEQKLAPDHGSLRTESQLQERRNQEKQDGGDRQETKNIDGQYMEPNRDFKNATHGQFSDEQRRPVDYNIQQRNFANEQIKEELRPQDSKNVNSGQENAEDGKQPDSQNNTNQPNDATSEQYYQDKGYGDSGQEKQPPVQEQGLYGDPNHNYDAQDQPYNYSQEDAQYYQQSDNNYYQQPEDQGQNGGQEQKNYNQTNEQEYYQDKAYYGQQDQTNPEYDPNQQYQQYSNEYQDKPQEQYDPQQEQYDSQQQQYDPKQQQYDSQQYDPQQQQYDPQQQQHDPQQQQNDPQHQQHDPQQQNRDPQQQHNPQQQNRDPQQQHYDQQQHDPQQQQRDPQQQHYDPQQQQQYDPQQQQRDPQQQHYDPQQHDPQQQQRDLEQQYDQQQYDPQQQQRDPEQHYNQQQYDPQQQQYDPQQQQYDSQQQQYGGDSYGWQQSSDQEQSGGAQNQYEYYGQQTQEGYYDPQSQGGNQYEYQQQNPNASYSGNERSETIPAREEGQGNPPREEISTKFYETSDDSTQESDRSREVLMGRSHESPSQRSIDRYRTMLGVDPNSDPAYSEVDEIEDEMAAVVASGTGAARTQPADNAPPSAFNIPSQNQPKLAEINPKQLHDDSSDFDYSSGP